MRHTVDSLTVYVVLPGLPDGNGMLVKDLTYKGQKGLWYCISRGLKIFIR